MAPFTERTQDGLLLESLRLDYRLSELNEANCETNPIRQFEKWFQQAQSAELKEPNAMALATATAGGRPSVRIVLLKEVTRDGFVFYSNYGSRKGQELGTNPACALSFYWAELERTVRVEGLAGRVSPEKSEAYYRTRPRGSRLGALVSNQSEVLPNREVLEKRLAELETQYAGTDEIPLPDNWGGYLVIPEQMEFWQGRTNRLHDRILYTKTEDGWAISRLSP